MSTALKRPSQGDEWRRIKRRVTAVERLLPDGRPIVPQPVAVFSHPGVIETEESGFRVPRYFGQLYDCVATLGVAGVVTVAIKKRSPFPEIDPDTLATITLGGAELSATQSLSGVCIAAEFDLLGVEVTAADGTAEDLVVEVRMSPR